MRPRDLPNWHEALLRAWHLAVLRFAITRDNADRLAVLAVANEIDRQGRAEGGGTSFSFFRRTSAGLLAAITLRSEPGAKLLDQYMASIGSARLRRAFTAALEIELPHTRSFRRSRREFDLWKDLPSRAHQRNQHTRR